MSLTNSQRSEVKAAIAETLTKSLSATMEYRDYLTWLDAMSDQDLIKAYRLHCGKRFSF